MNDKINIIGGFMRRKVLANNHKIIEKQTISEYQAMDLWEAKVASAADKDDLDALYLDLDNRLKKYNDVFAEFVINNINHNIRVGGIKLDNDVVSTIDSAMKNVADNAVLGRLVLDGRTVKRIAQRASYWLDNWRIR